MNHKRIALLAAALAVLGACGSDKTASSGTAAQAGAPAGSATGAATTSAAGNAGALGGAAVQLKGDACALLTVPEMEAVLGSGVEQGGFGNDLPGRCTYSLGGDVGAGVVQIILQDPLECNPVMKALASGSLQGTNAVRVDVGDGGFYIQDAQVVFTIHGGCVAVGGSKSGVNLGQEKLVALASAVAGRVA
jgi:hypothetical protein